MKTMQSKYPGTCAKCGKPFAKGELINYYGRGRGVEHAHQCGNRQDNSSHEDRACGDMAYEDACAAACGGGL